MVELEEAVKEAIMPAYRDKVQNEDFRWDFLGKLIVKLPLDLRQERLNECVDMDRLNALQGMYFESVQVKKTTLDETFARMIDHTEKEDKEGSEPLRDTSITSNFSLTNEIQANAETVKVTWRRSLVALLKTDFSWSNLWR
jgi:hypothetical protein